MNRVEGPFDLTPLQTKYLRNLREFCSSPPSLARFYTKALPLFFALFLFFGLLMFAVVAYEMVEAAYVLGGMLFGIMLRDLSMYRRAIDLWPATSAVVDRVKLAELTEQPLDEPENW